MKPTDIKLFSGNDVVHDDQAIRYYHEWKLHRSDGPAVEYHSGGHEWYLNGNLHRDNGPARELDKIQEWYQHGKLHRSDGPARITYYKKEWYKHGKLHRTNGPAIESKVGAHRWALDDQLLSFDEWCGILGYDNKHCLIYRLKYFSYV